MGSIIFWLRPNFGSDGASPDAPCRTVLRALPFNDTVKHTGGVSSERKTSWECPHHVTLPSAAYVLGTAYPYALRGVRPTFLKSQKFDLIEGKTWVNRGC